jgi:hypothetical protein
MQKREWDDKGKPGILHVKCAVAAGRWMLLSSANQKEYVFILNMELGPLITGDSLPSHVEAQFDRLIETGVLARP